MWMVTDVNGLVDVRLSKKIKKIIMHNKMCEGLYHACLKSTKPVVAQ